MTAALMFAPTASRNAREGVWAWVAPSPLMRQANNPGDHTMSNYQHDLDAALEGYPISRRTARAWVAAHHVSFSEFTEEYGRSDTYCSRDVLIWLGY